MNLKKLLIVVFTACFVTLFNQSNLINKKIIHELMIFQATFFVMGLIEVLSKTQLAPALLLNIILLYFILNYSRQSIGSYKYLLVMFSSCNILLATAHFVLDPQIVNGIYTFNVVLNIYCGSRLLTVAFCVLYEIPLALLTVHIVYRYLAVVAPEKLRIFSDWKFFGWLAFYIIGHACLYAYISLALTPEIDTPENIEARAELALRICQTINDGWISITCWRNGEIVQDSLIFIMFASVIECTNLVVTIAFALLTYRAIRGTAHHAYTTSNRFQMQLFVAICAQTAIPIVFVYSCYLVNLNLPLLGVKWEVFEIMSTFFISLFPVLDPIVMIVLMKPYRDGFMSIFVKKTSVFIVRKYDSALTNQITAL